MARYTPRFSVTAPPQWAQWSGNVADSLSRTASSSSSGVSASNGPAMAYATLGLRWPSLQSGYGQNQTYSPTSVACGTRTTVRRQYWHWTVRVSGSSEGMVAKSVTGVWSISEAMPLGPGNHLLSGDDATVMRDIVGTRRVDLICLDPPFKSDKNYNLIYSTMTGKPVPEQAEAFCDTWTLKTTKAEMLERLPPQGFQMADGRVFSDLGSTDRCPDIAL